MKKISKARGIILGKRKLKEIDLIIDVLCEAGERRVFRVHGILNSKRRSPIDYSPGNFIEVDYYDTGQITNNQIMSIKELNIIESWSDSFHNYRMLEMLSFILETIDSVSKEGATNSLFLLLKGSIRQLTISAEIKSEISLLLLFIEIRCLKFLGVLGQTDICSSCGIGLYEYASWQFPEMYFLCQTCTTDQESNDINIAQLISMVIKFRFPVLLEQISKSFLEFQNIDLINEMIVKFRNILEASVGIKYKTGIS